MSTDPPAPNNPDGAADRPLYWPIVAEVPDTVWEAVQGGQPVLLTREGEPAVVVIDLDSYTVWEEAWEDATGTAP